MKNNDVIRLFEKSLYVQFGSTGECRSVSALRLDRGVTFDLFNNTIEARYHDSGEPVVVERFSSDSLARAGFQHLQAAVKRHTRNRRYATFTKNTIKWGVVPAFIILFALALNMATTRIVNGSAHVLNEMEGKSPLVPLPVNIGATTPLGPSPAPLTTTAEMRKALASGVNAGKYSVQMSKGPKGSLYVFSDPSCSHCQKLEAQLEKLGKDFTIHIFPVTVIGGQTSAHLVSKVLCATPDKRAALWKKVARGADPSLAECADGATAFAANNQFFLAARFAGTPTLLNEAGERLPEAIPNTAEAITKWLGDQ